MDLQILYNNPRKAHKFKKKENLNMRTSFKRKKKNPAPRIYKRSIEAAQLEEEFKDAEAEAKGGKKKGKKDTDVSKSFYKSKKPLYTAGRFQYMTPAEEQKYKDMADAYVKKAQDLMVDNIPGADAMLKKAEAAFEQIKEMKKKQKEKLKEEQELMQKKGYLDVPFDPKSEGYISPKKAMALNAKEKKEKLRFEKKMKQLHEALVNLDKQISGKAAKRRKKKASKSTSKKARKKATRKAAPSFRKKATKKKPTRKKATRKKASKKKATRKKASKKAMSRRSSTRRKGNPIKIFDNPKDEMKAMKKSGGSYKKKKKSKKAKTSIAEQFAEMAGKPSKKKKKASKKKASKKKASKKKASKRKSNKKKTVKAISHVPSVKKRKSSKRKSFKAKTHKVKRNPDIIKKIKETFMKPIVSPNKPFAANEKSILNHSVLEASSLIGGGALVSVFNTMVSQKFIQPFIGKYIQNPMGARVASSLADFISFVALGNLVGMHGSDVAQELKKGLIGASAVKLGADIVTVSSGAAMNGIIAVPSMNGIISVPSMNGIIGVPAMNGLGQFSADFQGAGLGASGMQNSDFGAYKTVGLEGSYLQQADFDSGSPIPTAPRNPESLGGFGAYEDVEYSDDGEDADF